MATLAGASTLRVTGVDVTVPKLLATVTVKVSPLFAAVVAGVV
jgi:hypothetical protein